MEVNIQEPKVREGKMGKEKKWTIKDKTDEWIHLSINFSIKSTLLFTNQPEVATQENRIFMLIISLFLSPILPPSSKYLIPKFLFFNFFSLSLI